jgi:hypothetical protein
MYISLSSKYAGNACAIAQSIINYVGKNKTQFFDWLVCSLKSINEVLEGKEILFEENYIYPNPLNTTSINFKNFHLLTSHHDINVVEENSIKEITEKYKRRYNRLIENINNETNIFFIRYCKDNNDIEENEINNFYENIIRINNNLNFHFILVSDYDNINISENLLLKKNFKYINLKDFYNDDIINEKDDYCKTIKSYKCIYEK